MIYEQEGAHLLTLLRRRWGEEPGWTLRPNREHGFYLLYRQEVAPLGEVRQLIETTFGLASSPTFIIGDLHEHP